jgi:RNA polymerase sigma factor (sigma-70 family)
VAGRNLFQFLVANELANRPTDFMGDGKNELISTRTTLLERLRDWKDDSSWREFFNIYSKLIRGVAIKKGLTVVEAEDVVQETMLAAAKYIPNFKYDRKLGSFKQWLLNMSRWRICDQFRRRSNTVSQLPNDPAADPKLGYMLIDENNVNFDELWEAEWQKSLLDNAIKNIRTSLDPKKYQIFDFLINKEWPPEKVAKSFGISLNQVYLTKHRISALIKEEVERLKSSQL